MSCPNKKPTRPYWRRSKFECILHLVAGDAGGSVIAGVLSRDCRCSRKGVFGRESLAASQYRDILRLVSQWRASPPQRANSLLSFRPLTPAGSHPRNSLRRLGMSTSIRCPCGRFARPEREVIREPFRLYVRGGLALHRAASIAAFAGETPAKHAAASVLTQRFAY